jgi:hypothetical protein
MTCNICYQDFPQFKLINAGCCSLQLCKTCIKLCDKCPQCKKKYFWIKNEDNKVNFKIFELEQKIMNLSHSLTLSEEDTYKLSKKILEQGKEIKQLKEIINNDIEISHQYKNQYNNVILKYHLNII